MEAILYPENLKGLNLTFAEAIYAIAFQLEGEIRIKGKEAVFQELGMTEEEMTERVDHCLDKTGYSYRYTYALMRVLGNVDSSARDEEIFGRHNSLGSAFESIVKKLRADGNEEWRTIPGKNYRHLLTKSERSEPKGSSSAASSITPNQLYAQVQQLMIEVRLYDEKRDRALARIEELISKIQQRADCPKDFGQNLSVSEGVSGLELSQHDIDLDDPITQIVWPHRSMDVLQELHLNTIRDVVQHFRDFKHYIEVGDLTLMEWLVISTILRKRGLLIKDVAVYRLDDTFDHLDLSVRAYNCLRRAVGDACFSNIVTFFACGAVFGSERLEMTRMLGRKTYEEIISKLSDVVIEIDDNICYPTTESPVWALDFGSESQIKLAYYELNTVGELLAACLDKNRFSGLEYIDSELYSLAKDQLKAYGFLSDN